MEYITNNSIVFSPQQSIDIFFRASESGVMSVQYVYGLLRAKCIDLVKAMYPKQTNICQKN